MTHNPKEVNIESAVVEFDELKSLQSLVNDHFKSYRSLDVLEAGCGASSRLSYPVKPVVTGVDISKIQLDRNLNLDQKIHADIQTYALPSNQYDLVISWDVFEHLNDPETALLNLVQATRKNGLIILALPNVSSLKGLVTKFTPHAFHVWVYRNFFDVPEAGKEGNRPFKAYLRFFLSPNNLRKFAAQHKLGVLRMKTYEFEMQKYLRKKYPVFNFSFGALGFISQALSFGRYDTNHSDLICVLQR